MISKDVKIIILASLVVAGVGTVSNMTYNDQVDEQNKYCEMVRSGSWPDFKGLYEEMCP